MKKILAFSVVIAMLAIAIVGGTLAYFTDTDEAVNEFVIGNVAIDQNEWQRGEEGAIVEFEQDKNVVPAVYKYLTPKSDITVDGYDFTIRNLEGNYIDKIVNVTNTGSNLAYVRTIIAVPNMNGYDDTADASHNPLHWNYLDATDFDGIGWDWNGSNDEEATEQLCYAQDVIIDGASYDIYVATYNVELTSGEITSPSMVGFYLDPTVDCDEDGYFFVDGNGEKQSLKEWMNDGSLKFLVATQAVQADGFADAWEALDEAFGAISADNLPWEVDEPAA